MPLQRATAQGPATEERTSMTMQGYCQCGCGARTWIATKNSEKDGWVKGQPVRFAKGHQRRVDGYEIDPETGCWNWAGYATPDTGYGKISIDGRAYYAHRVYYERHVGPIAPGLTIDHLCRNRRCVNPAHLEAVTRGENTLRGESTSGINLRKTHCPKGHPLSGENLYECRGRRQCRTCRAAHLAAYVARKKAA
jgi:hypothetical protein